jgi:RND family efflux transporter, MFP subunit
MNSPEESTPKAEIGQSAPEAAKPRFRLGLIAGVLAVLIIVGFFVGMVPHWRQSNVTSADTQALAIPTVAVVSPAPGKSGADLMLPAEIKPWLEASIYAQVSGYLKSWLVDIGAHVEAGTSLAEIDTPELDQQLGQARAQLVLAQANLNLATITDERWQAALKRAAVSEQEAAEKAAARAVMAANVQAATANLRRLEQMEAFKHVTAPFAGTVSLRNVDIGDLIIAGSGGKQLFHLIQADKLRVYVRVPEPDAPGVRPGQSAELMLSQVSAQPIPLKITTTAGAVSPISRTLQVELEADNSHGLIFPGNYGQVRLTDSKSAPKLVLPSNALIFRGHGLQVGVVSTNNTVELHQVQVGRDFGQTVEILSGVTAADRVIANPSDSLVSGMVVRVAQSQPSAPSK